MKKPAEPVQQQARYAAQRALTLDPKLPAAHLLCVFRSWKAAIPTDAGPGFRMMPGRV
jgi:hypothetical protein